MFFSRWFRARPRTRHTYRPTLLQLEDRITPSSSLGLSGPATHFAVLATSVADAGRPTSILVEAEDAHNLPAFSYAGTVHFSLGTPDPNAHLPANYTFSLRDHGAHLFQITLSAAGNQTVTVTDMNSTSITGSVTENVVAAPVASRFVIQMPASVTAGQPVPVNVMAQDSSGNRAWFYTGTVSFSSSDGKAVFPTSYQFTPQDFGAHTFLVTFNSTGSQSFKVTDSANSSISGTGNTTVNAAPVAAGFTVLGLSNPTVGVPTTASVMAVDNSGRPLYNYTGTVYFTSSDPKAVLPPDTPVIAGRGRVPVTFNTPGSQTLTAIATTGSPAISGQETVTVVASPPINQLEAFALGTASVGTPTAIMIVALDSNNLLVAGYRGTLNFTSSDKSANLQASYTYSSSDHGRHIFYVTFNTPGTQTITVSDPSNSSLTITITVQVS